MRLRIASVVTAALGLAALLLALSLFADAPAAADQTTAPRVAPQASRMADVDDTSVAASASGPTPIVDAGPVSPVAEPTRPRVLVVGDSITHSAHGRLLDALTPVVAEVRILAWGGTAPCDWIGPVADEVAAFDPDLVLLEFVGNDLTPCIAGTPRGSDGFVDRSRADAVELTAVASRFGAIVRWTSIPPIAVPAYDAIAVELNGIYRSLSHEGVLTPLREALTVNGGFGFTDTCRGEAECDGVAVGTSVPLRSDDGLHLAEAGSARMAELYRAAVVRVV